MKILFLTTGEDAPSFRFRIGQMLPFFEEQGHVCVVNHLPKHIWSRLIYFSRLDMFDAILLQRSLLSSMELSLLKKRANHLFYDIDDAVMFNSDGQSRWKRSRRFQNTMRMVDVALCGNRYLADEAVQRGGTTKVIPTAVPVKKIQADAKTAQKHDTDKIVVGWTGSRSTCRYLNDLFPVLATFGEQIHLKLISNAAKNFRYRKLGNVTYEHFEWSRETEYSQLADVQIGLMPLPDNVWTRGKCGFKALQYMSLGIPTICSPVGMNSQLIQSGKNGYLANSHEEWEAALKTLVETPFLREAIGQAGHIKVLEQYDLDVIGPLLVKTIEERVEPKQMREAA